MKVKVVTELNPETGDYEMSFHNLSHPGEGIDYNVVRNMMSKIFGQLDRDIEDSGTNSTDLFTKDIH